MTEIDRKYKIEVTSRNSGKKYTEGDGVFFKASDPAFNQSVFDAYKRECIRLGADFRQIEAIDLLAARVSKWRLKNPALVKVPDIDLGKEAAYTNRPNEEEDL